MHINKIVVDMNILIGSVVFNSFIFQFIIGSGKNMCDFTYVENVAHAHVCAEQALRSSGALVAGKVCLHLCTYLQFPFCLLCALVSHQLLGQFAGIFHYQ